MVYINTKEDIAGMRAAGRLAADVLNKVGKKVRYGVSTLELNDYVDQITSEAGATSAPFQYKASPTDRPFPKHCCTSVNQVVCHGIPSDKVWLSKRDIINVDITVILNGYHGDTSRTFFAGKPKPEIKKLVEITEQAMHKGIESVKPGACISDIGKAIEEFVKPHNYGIVEQLTGHGIGKNFHQEPAIYHFNAPHYKLELVPGMTFTVEPMLNLGTKEIGLLDDGWTIITKDGKWSAQFEHTILVTDSGVEILTKAD
jgi:methionyl aminopeptidase